MKRSLALALVAGLALAAVAEVTLAGEKGVVSPAAELKWMDSPGLKGARWAVLWGDPAKGPYGAIRSIPGGTMMGLHTHSSTQRAVVVSGTVEFTMEGEAKKTLGAGSYAFIPADARHDVTCKAGADCVYFEEGLGPADYKPVTKN